jgi:hypothetical protein
MSVRYRTVANLAVHPVVIGGIGSAPRSGGLLGFGGPKPRDV